jgi:hypothetical protein
VKSVWRGSSNATSGACGSLTLTIMSASPNTASASGRIFAPWATYSSSSIAEPTPAPGLDHDLVAVLGQLAHARRRERDPVLVSLDLGGDADLQRTSFRQVMSSRPRSASQKSMRSRAESSDRPVSSSTRRIR